MPRVPAASPSFQTSSLPRMLRLLDRLSACFGRSQNLMAPHLATGLRGEEEAFFYLRRLGYVLIARRWRTPQVPGDVDLIGWEGDTLCFVEVKTRTGRDIVPAEFAVDGHKQETLRRLAAIFRKRLPEYQRKQLLMRFDVVSVYLSPDNGADRGPEMELFRDAFRSHRA